MRRYPIRLMLLVSACLLPAACSGLAPKANPTNPSYMPNPDDTHGSIGGDNGDILSSLFGKGKNNNNGNGGAALGVNAYLWRGALDTLSFMPLASADPFGGVIITDWYTPPATPGERFKATAYVLGGQLRSNGVRVSIFRQVLQNGQWVDAPVSNVTVSDIENKVLARARQLRAQSQASS